MRADPIHVIETGYQLGGTDEEWLRSIAEAVRPLMDGGHGIMAYAFDVAQPPETWIQAPVLIDMGPDEVQGVIALGMTMRPGELAALQLDPEPLTSVLEAMPRMRGPQWTPSAAWMEHFARLGPADYLALRTIEPGGRGIVVTAGQTAMRSIDRRTRRLWARVSTHLAAARRLRAALAESAESAAREAAVLTPSGRLEHAEGDAKAHPCRQALQRAVLHQEKARGRQRREDPHAATEAWRALVTGRWSLVDRFDRDGRRYLVARPNEIHVPDPRALSTRERAVAQLAALGKPNKLIGYELGIAPSTVANHLAAAARKLGARSRSELVTLVARMPTA
jgi:DNA-binding CsgD family transcriptional regulator